MTFQTTVYNNMGFGVVGEGYLDGPIRAQPAKLDSTDPANNVVGRAFTVADDGTASFETSADPKPITVAAGGTGVFAGILGNPKNYVLSGTTAGGTLASSLALPDQTIVELFQEHPGLIVALGVGTAVGNWVYFLNATGVLSSAAPGITNAPADSTRVPGGRVERFESAAAGLAVISFNSNVDPQEAVV